MIQIHKITSEKFYNFLIPYQDDTSRNLDEFPDHIGSMITLFSKSALDNLKLSKFTN